RLTELGDRIRGLPLHPRLARMLIAAGGAREIAQACALLSERHYLPARSAATTSDLLSALDDWRTMPPHVQRVAQEIEALGKGVGILFDPARVLPGGRSSGGEADNPTGDANPGKETRPL